MDKVFVYLGLGAESFTCPLQSTGSISVTGKTADKAIEVERTVLVKDAIANRHLIVADKPAVKEEKTK